MTNESQKENINTWLSEINVQHKMAVSVDCVIFGYSGEDIYVLMMECNMPPYEGQYSLIGDLVHSDESLTEAAKRILKQKANLESVYLEQVEVFSKVDRHPISRVITVAYYALVNMEEFVIHDAENRGLEWKPFKQDYDLAYDHNEILKKCIQKLRQRMINEPVGIKILPQKFTIQQLRSLYEMILDIDIDKRNFRRKLSDLNILIELDEVETNVHHRPAKLYTFNQEMTSKNMNIIPNYKN